MEIVAEMEAPCTPAALFAWVDALDRYPAWLEIVTRATPRADTSDDVPTWDVDLRGRIGPLARTKRLRMVRAVHHPDERVVFERRELDGRSHSPWVLDAAVMPSEAASPGGSRLVMVLRYGGGLFGPVLERILRDEIEQSRLRLLHLVSADAEPSSP
ncbi:MAG TPA: SRPBCC family protein [Acidimicrobiales bacterium]|jgi:hypothetical protein|nr:SRPBCC family protein [Acidimicrobiales bacterium]HRA34401.1 SRPBCC family protein [Acidimicrobiales bacterium]